jgi:hypothetical protein
MNYYKITFKLHDGHKWRTAYRTLQANSPEDAVKKADMWPELIKKVELI